MISGVSRNRNQWRFCYQIRPVYFIKRVVRDHLAWLKYKGSPRNEELFFFFFLLYRISCVPRSKPITFSDRSTNWNFFLLAVHRWKKRRREHDGRRVVILNIQIRRNYFRNCLYSIVNSNYYFNKKSKLERGSFEQKSNLTLFRVCVRIGIVHYSSRM